jgi:hypothetical protein
MAKRKQIMILDVETNHEQTVFDISVLVADLHGNVTELKQWIIEEIFPEQLFWEQKRPEYLKVIADTSHPAKLVGIAQALQELAETIEKYAIQTVYAYNASFDYRAIAKISHLYQLPNPLENVEIDCLWFWSAQTIFQQKNFLKWADRHHEYALTEKGNYKTSAEICFAYINDEPNFTEVHRGIEDCLIEYQIFLKCRQQKKLRVKGICHNAWLLVQPEDRITRLPQQFQTMQLQLLTQIEKAQKVANKLNKPLRATLETA